MIQLTTNYLSFIQYTNIYDIHYVHLYTLIYDKPVHESTLEFPTDLHKYIPIMETNANLTIKT